MISKISYIFASGETRLNVFNKANLSKKFKEEDEGEENEEEGEGEGEGAEYNEEEEEEIVGAIKEQIGEAAAESDKTADADDIYNHVNHTVGELCGVKDFNLITENDTTMLANIASAYEQNTNQRKGKRAH